MKLLPMNPQPPVTKMRIAGPTSRGGKGAPAVSPRFHDWWEAFAENRWTPWLILALAAALRFLFLGIKAPHFDEGINGWFVDQMTRTGFYRYDPTNYHGPLHFYILFLFESLFGRNLWAIRLPVALGSLGCVFLALRYEVVVGRGAALLAALAMAVSPAFVFYGRYSIHEVWLLLFNMLFLLGLLGLWKTGARSYLWATFLGLAGMVLTKETYIIHLGCVLLAFPVAVVSQKITPLPDFDRAEQKWSFLDLALAVLSAIFLVVFFYSGTFFNWEGVKGLYLTFSAWFETGKAGNGHEKDWWYWLMLIGRYEIPVGLGLLFCVFCQTLRNVALRYLAIYGVGVLAAYSIVPYKTPWCIISMVWPLLFLFGAGVLALFARLPRLAVLFASLLLAWSLGHSIWLNFFHYEDDKEPYVYVQTYSEINRLTDPLLALAREDPANYHLVGHLIRPSSYPLPWVLGDFTRVGYYEQDNLPGTLDADFLLVQEAKIKEVEARLRDTYFTEPLRIRPYQDTSRLYLRAPVFQKFFAGRTPEFKGRGADTPGRPGR